MLWPTLTIILLGIAGNNISNLRLPVCTFFCFFFFCFSLFFLFFVLFFLMLHRAYWWCHTSIVSALISLCHNTYYPFQINDVKTNFYIYQPESSGSFAVPIPKKEIDLSEFSRNELLQLRELLDGKCRERQVAWIWQSLVW